MRWIPLWVPPKLGAVFLSFTSNNLDITGDYRQGLFGGVVKVSLLGYSLIILFHSSTIQLLAHLFSTSDIRNSTPLIRNQETRSDPSSKQATLKILDVYRWTLAANFFIPLESVRSNPKVVRILTTMWGTNSMIVKFKLDVYLMSMTLKKLFCICGHRINADPGHKQNDCER